MGKRIWAFFGRWKLRDPRKFCELCLLLAAPLPHHSAVLSGSRNTELSSTLFRSNPMSPCREWGPQDSKNIQPVLFQKVDPTRCCKHAHTEWFICFRLSPFWCCMQYVSFYPVGNTRMMLYEYQSPKGLEAVIVTIKLQLVFTISKVA